MQHAIIREQPVQHIQLTLTVPEFRTVLRIVGHCPGNTHLQTLWREKEHGFLGTSGSHVYHALCETAVDAGLLRTLEEQIALDEQEAAKF